MKTAAILSLLTLTSAFSWAADPAPPDGREPWDLSLREAVAGALERNLDLAVARLDPASSAEDIVIADAAFDSRFESSVGYSRDTSEPSSGFASERTTRKTAQASYTDPLRYGAQYGVQFDYSEISYLYPRGREQQFGLISSPVGASLTVSYSQSLLRNYGLLVNRTAIDQAALAKQGAEEALRTRIFDIVEQVENAYWGLVGAQRQVDVAAASLELANDFLRQTKIRVDVGVLAPIEITTAEAEVAARVEGVLTAENAVRNAEDVLRALIRVPEDSAAWDRPIRPTDRPGFAPVQVDVGRAIAQALERRSELASAKLSLRAGELNRRHRENQIKPDLSLTAQFQLSGNNFDYRSFEYAGLTPEYTPCTADPTQFCITFAPSTTTLLAPQAQGRFDAIQEIPSFDNNYWSVGALLSIPVRNRAARAELAKARLAVDQASLQLDGVKQTIRVEVRTAVRDLETAAQRVETTRKNVELQRRKLDAEQKRYENGLSTAFQVLTYQKDLRDAESSEIIAVVDYNRALTHLARVTGALLEERGITM